MGKIDELIQQYCPEGVEYVPFAEVFDIITDYTAAGSFKSIADNVKYLKVPDYAMLVRTTDLKSRFGKGDFIYVSQSAFNYLWRVKMDKECIVMPNVGNCGEIYYVKPEDLPYSHCVLGPNAILVRSNTYNNRFFSYCLQVEHFQKQLVKITSPVGQSKFNKTELKKLEIPLPPLPVQEEIVRILDNFTNLAAELQAELQARQQQYQYYRDTLLSFDGRTDVQWMKLGEVANVYDGTHQTPAYKDSGIPFISVENISDIYSSKKYISQEDFDKYKIKPNVGDVFMTRIGSIGVCAVFDKPASIAYYVSLALIRPKQDLVLSRYLKHIIESRTGRKELRKRTLVNAVPIKVNKDDIGKIVLPIPSLSEQQRIVDILDRFDTLVNDLSQGLPAEIEARQQQYEYYRDQLLTFKRKEA